MTIKVADFGLSRDLFSRDYYRLEDRKTPLPVRWMAPECFEANVFTVYSDVVCISVYLRLRVFSNENDNVETRIVVNC